jgi:hypothetical protein
MIPSNGLNAESSNNLGLFLDPLLFDTEVRRHFPLPSRFRFACGSSSDGSSLPNASLFRLFEMWLNSSALLSTSVSIRVSLRRRGLKMKVCIIYAVMAIITEFTLQLPKGPPRMFPGTQCLLTHLPIMPHALLRWIVAAGRSSGTTATIALVR